MYIVLLITDERRDDVVQYGAIGPFETEREAYSYRAELMRDETIKSSYLGSKTWLQKRTGASHAYVLSVAMKPVRSLEQEALEQVRGEVSQIQLD